MYLQKKTKLGKFERVKDNYEDVKDILNYIYSFSYYSWVIKKRHQEDYQEKGKTHCFDAYEIRQHLIRFNSANEFYWMPSVAGFTDMSKSIDELYDMYEKFYNRCDSRPVFTGIIMESESPEDFLNQLIEKFPDSEIWDDIYEREIISDPMTIIYTSHIQVDGELKLVLSYEENGEVITEFYDKDKHLIKI